MKNIVPTLLLSLAFYTTEGICQKKGLDRYFGEPILTDTLSTLFIPTYYNEEFLTSNKIAMWGGYYANIVAYNFKTDTYKKVFDKDAFIESFRDIYYSYDPETGHLKNLTKKWVFLVVKTKDTNNSGRIDEKDASVLFALSTDGLTLKQLTDETENIASFDNFESQGFMMIKLQRDTDNDKSFRKEDNDFYFKKINLKDLTLGKGIEIK